MNYKTYVSFIGSLGLALSTTACVKEASDIAAAESMSIENAAIVATPTRVDLEANQRLSITPEFLQESGAMQTKGNLKITSVKVMNSRLKEVDAAAVDKSLNPSGDISELQANLSAIGTGIYIVEVSAVNDYGASATVRYKVYQTDKTASTASGSGSRGWTMTSDGKTIIALLSDAQKAGAPSSVVEWKPLQFFDAVGDKVDAACFGTRDKSGTITQFECDASVVASGSFIFYDSKKDKVEVKFTVSSESSKLAYRKMVEAAPLPMESRMASESLRKF